MSDSRRPVQVLNFSFSQFLLCRILEPTLLVVSSTSVKWEFKMAAAEGKFVWLETLRKARKTSLVQDGKWYKPENLIALGIYEVLSTMGIGNEDWSCKTECSGIIIRDISLNWNLTCSYEIAHYRLRMQTDQFRKMCGSFLVPSNLEKPEDRGLLRKYTDKTIQDNNLFSWRRLLNGL